MSLSEAILLSLPFVCVKTADSADLAPMGERREPASLTEESDKAAALSDLAAREAEASQPDELEDIGGEYLRLGSPDEAMRVSARLRELHPDRAAGYRLAARALYMSGDYEEAARRARAALDRDPHDAAVLTILKLAGRGRSKPAETREDSPAEPAPESSVPSGRAAVPQESPLARVRPPPAPGVKDPRDAARADPPSRLGPLWKGSAELGKHREQAVTYKEFYRQTRFMSSEGLIHQMDEPARGQLSAGPNLGYRFVRDPADPMRVIDMRHFVAVGSKRWPESYGAAIEVYQYLYSLAAIDPKQRQRARDTALDPQDFYSNALGKEFFRGRYVADGKPIGLQLRDYFLDRQRRER
ncbi:MAG: hypothetical protein ABII00_05585 [Elusimicrobiota bacterium]